MLKSPHRWVVAILAFVAPLLLVGWLLRPASNRSFFSPAPSGLTILPLRVATNYLRLVDPGHTWRAVSVSNGTSKTLFFFVSEVEYRTPDGWRSAGNWLSNTLTNTSLRTVHESPPEVPPGSVGAFYVGLAVTNLPWRLRLGCFEHGWQETGLIKRLDTAIHGPPTMPVIQSWSGARYELISEEVSP